MINYTLSDRVRVILGDAFQVLSSLPDESVDLVVADPPYRLSNGGVSVSSGKFVSVNKASWDKSLGVTNDFEFHARWIEECRRILKPNGAIWISGTYHSIYQCGYALQQQGWRIINEIVWFKPNAAPNLSRKTFTASHESLIWAAKTTQSKFTFNYEQMKAGDFPEDKLKISAKQMRSVWSIPSTPKREKLFGTHPTQKPLALINRIVLASSNPEDVILDPFCGTATTGVSAVRHQRRFIGIDSDYNYLNQIAIPRLKSEINDD